jgi:hypothetical protein
LFHFLDYIQCFYFGRNYIQCLNWWTNHKNLMWIWNEPESMSFSNVHMFVIHICSSAQIFAVWSSVTETSFNFRIQIDAKIVKRFVIWNVPFMWERKCNLGFRLSINECRKFGIIATDEAKLRSIRKVPLRLKLKLPFWLLKLKLPWKEWERNLCDFRMWELRERERGVVQMGKIVLEMLKKMIVSKWYIIIIKKNQ